MDIGSITATLSQDEYTLLEAFVAERGIENLNEALPAMIRELVRLYDQQWDECFTQNITALEAMAQQVLEQRNAG
jgi:hypothetical protein